METACEWQQKRNYCNKIILFAYGLRKSLTFKVVKCYSPYTFALYYGNQLSILMINVWNRQRNIKSKLIYVTTFYGFLKVESYIIRIKDCIFIYALWNILADFENLNWYGNVHRISNKSDESSRICLTSHFL